MPPRSLATVFLCLLAASVTQATAQTETRPAVHRTEHDRRPEASRTHDGHHRHRDEARRRTTRHITGPRARITPVPLRAVAPVPPPVVARPKPMVGASTGLPIPRFAALRADEVNMRAGPGTQYPIEWVFKHQDMPVEIEREFDVWRLVEAPDGTKGWIHQATLIGTRTFFVPAAGPPLALRRAAADDAPVVAMLEPGVIGRLVRCDPASAWCRVSVHGMEGSVERSSVWGLLPDEAIGMTP